MSYTKSEEVLRLQDELSSGARTVEDFSSEERILWIDGLSDADTLSFLGVMSSGAPSSEERNSHRDAPPSMELRRIESSLSSGDQTVEDLSSLECRILINNISDAQMVRFLSEPML